MNIKDASSATGISRDMIRFYEKKGMIHPVHNQENGYREYSNDDLYRLVTIRQYSTLGIPLSTIAAMLDNRDPELCARALDSCIEKLHQEETWLAERLSFAEEARQLSRYLQQGLSFQAAESSSCCFYPNQAGSPFSNNAAKYVSGGVFRPVFRVRMEEFSRQSMRIESGMRFHSPLTDSDLPHDDYGPSLIYRTIWEIPADHQIGGAEIRAMLKQMSRHGYAPDGDCFGYEIIGNGGAGLVNMEFRARPIRQ